MLCTKKASIYLSVFPEPRATACHASSAQSFFNKILERAWKSLFFMYNIETGRLSRTLPVAPLKSCCRKKEENLEESNRGGKKRKREGFCLSLSQTTCVLADVNDRVSCWSTTLSASWVLGMWTSWAKSFILSSDLIQHTGKLLWSLFSKW